MRSPDGGGNAPSMSLPSFITAMRPAEYSSERLSAMRFDDSVRDSAPYTVAVIRLRMTIASSSSSSVKPRASGLFVGVTAISNEIEQLDGVGIALVPEDVEDDA